MLDTGAGKVLLWNRTDLCPSAVYAPEEKPFANCSGKIELMNKLNSRKVNVLIISTFIATGGAMQPAAIFCGEADL